VVRTTEEPQHTSVRCWLEKPERLESRVVVEQVDKHTDAQHVMTTGLNPTSIPSTKRVLIHMVTFCEVSWCLLSCGNSFLDAVQTQLCFPSCSVALTSPVCKIRTLNPARPHVMWFDLKLFVFGLCSSVIDTRHLLGMLNVAFNLS